MASDCVFHYSFTPKTTQIIPPRIVLSVFKETISTLKKVRYKVPLNFVKGLSSL